MRDDYFKSYKIFKFVQLALLVIFAVCFFLFLFLDENLRTSVFSNKVLLTICVFLWAFMLYSVACIIMDFRLLEGHIVHDHVLKRAVYVDTLTGIPNRFSCDQIFEKYDGDADISKIGCALITIDNLDEINQKYGRSSGNVALKDFSSVVERISAYYGFVGRNNGNEFLVVIEDCSSDKMSKFESELQKEMDSYNKTSGGYEISIKVAKALNETLCIKDFRELVVRLYGIAKV
ncbi:MAG: diguanylate cyclase [Lachnospiraceae bacterium]|nr:diguanylate cyclase [Lachnospiraceae bacterium]